MIDHSSVYFPHFFLPTLSPHRAGSKGWCPRTAVRVKSKKRRLGMDL